MSYQQEGYDENAHNAYLDEMKAQEEENAYHAYLDEMQAQAELEAELQAELDEELAFQIESELEAMYQMQESDYHGSQMDKQAQEEYDQKTIELVEQLRESYEKQRVEQKFEGFPKMPRFSREIVITEKIDGTNAQVLITEDKEVFAGSKTRFITPENDNYGFAKWVKQNEEELRKLGPGRHFGEWWGSGCQRGYGLTNGEKRFSLFNTSRWNSENIPSCCYVVPELYRGDFDTNVIEKVLSDLAEKGSAASPGFMNPEGIIIYHTAGNIGFKKTIKNDDVPKTKAN